MGYSNTFMDYSNTYNSNTAITADTITADTAYSPVYISTHTSGDTNTKIAWHTDNSSSEDIYYVEDYFYKPVKEPEKTNDVPVKKKRIKQKRKNRFDLLDFD